MRQHRERASIGMREQSLRQTAHHGLARDPFGLALGDAIEVVELRTAAAIAGKKKVNHAVYLGVGGKVGRVEVLFALDFPIAAPVLADQGAL